ncbi:Psma1 [Symbiodinium sp. CCMP2592]|nr:Psma1 [Symbiodinium sp. CCMP2592]
MSVLYLVCDLDNAVFTFTATMRTTWEFSRLSSFHQENGKDKFVIHQATDASNGTRWVLENQSKGAGNIFGTPKYAGNGPPFQGGPSPPRGMWNVWDCPFHLTDVMPRYDAIQSPFTVKVPFVEMAYREEGAVAYLELVICETALDDESLDRALQEMRRIMMNLAKRPEMVLFIRTDARQATSVPALRHVRKFLSFVQKDVGTESVLVGRGSAIILHTSPAAQGSKCCDRRSAVALEDDMSTASTEASEHSFLSDVEHHPAALEHIIASRRQAIAEHYSTRGAIGAEKYPATHPEHLGADAADELQLVPLWCKTQGTGAAPSSWTIEL